jgi:hypothetical protein
MARSGVRTARAWRRGSAFLFDLLSGTARHLILRKSDTAYSDYSTLSTATPRAKSRSMQHSRCHSWLSLQRPRMRSATWRLIVKKFIAVLAVVIAIAIPTLTQTANAALVSPSSPQFGDNGY